MSKKTILLLAGLACFILGFTSIIMTLIGVNWSFLDILESGGALVAFLLKILMAIGGVVLLFFSQIDWEREARESNIQ